MGDIVFIHGAYHGTWCWEKRFLRIFREKGYKTHYPDLRASWKEEKQKKLLETYVEELGCFVDRLDQKAVIVVHSAYSIVVLEYLKRYSDNVEAVIFISPLPVKLKFPRIVFGGVRQLMLGKRRVFFSDRLVEKDAGEYLNKLITREGDLTIETTRKHWEKNEKLPVPSLFVGSENDNCIKAEWVRENAKLLNGECIIYKELCHDMMLDPAAEEVAKDILQFIKNIKGKEM